MAAKKVCLAVFAGVAARMSPKTADRLLHRNKSLVCRILIPARVQDSPKAELRTRYWQRRSSAMLEALCRPSIGWRGCWSCSPEGLDFDFRR